MKKNNALPTSGNSRFPISVAEIARLKKESISRSGRWEIAQVPDPVSKKMMGEKSALTLTLIVRQESYFIITALVAMSWFYNRHMRKMGYLRKLNPNDPALVR